MRFVLLLCLTTAMALGVPGKRPQLSVLEFDDDGAITNRSQFTGLMDQIGKAAESSPDHRVALVAFIHGWKSDAHTRNKLEGFEQTLAGIATDQTVPVIGVYLAWPGVRTSIPLLKELTFWDRKHVAERLPAGEFLHILQAVLDKTRERNPSSPIILIGHSFGANVLESALAAMLLPNFETKPKGEVTAPADMVLLLNSAGNATHTKHFIDALNEYKVESQFPIALALSSEGDRVTRFMLPVGQLPGYVSGFRGKGTLYLRSAGNVRQLQSHEFCDAAPDCLATIPESENRSPYWIARAPREVIPDHKSIFGAEFQRFLSAAIEHRGLFQPGRTPLKIRWSRL